MRQSPKGAEFWGFVFSAGYAIILSVTFFAGRRTHGAKGAAAEAAPVRYGQPRRGYGKGAWSGLRDHRILLGAPAGAAGRHGAGAPADRGRPASVAPRAVCRAVPLLHRPAGARCGAAPVPSGHRNGAGTGRDAPCGTRRLHPAGILPGVVRGAVGAVLAGAAGGRAGGHGTGGGERDGAGAGDAGADRRAGERPPAGAVSGRGTRQCLHQQNAAPGVDRAHGAVAAAHTPAQQSGGLGSPRPAGAGDGPHGAGAGYAAGSMSGGHLYH